MNRLEDFQLLDGTTIDTSLFKRDQVKVYHQHGAQINDQNQGINLVFGENNDYHQISTGYFKNDITLRKNSCDINNIADGTAGDPIRKTIIAFAYAFSIPTLSTTRGEEKEQNNHVGKVAAIRRLSTTKGLVLISHFDRIDKSQHGVKVSPLKNTF